MRTSVFHPITRPDWLVIRFPNLWKTWIRRREAIRRRKQARAELDGLKRELRDDIGLHQGGRFAEENEAFRLLMHDEAVESLRRDLVRRRG